MYVYVGNNPVNYTDPTGHFAIPVIVVAAAVGAALNTATYLLITPKDEWSWSGGLAAAGAGAVTGAAALIPGASTLTVVLTSAAANIVQYELTLAGEELFNDNPMPSGEEFLVEAAISGIAGAVGGWAGGGAADDVSHWAWDLTYGDGTRYKVFIPSAKNVVAKDIVKGAIGNVAQWGTTKGLESAE